MSVSAKMMVSGCGGRVRREQILDEITKASRVIIDLDTNPFVFFLGADLAILDPCSFLQYTFFDQKGAWGGEGRFRERTKKKEIGEMRRGGALVLSRSLTYDIYSHSMFCHHTLHP